MRHAFREQGQTIGKGVRIDFLRHSFVVLCSEAIVRSNGHDRPRQLAVESSDGVPFLAGWHFAEDRLFDRKANFVIEPDCSQIASRHFEKNSPQSHGIKSLHGLEQE